jgi:hypothetical protein
MGSFSLMHWVVVLMILAVPLVLVGVPVARILRRVGFGRWWCLLCFLPYGVGTLALAFAFAVGGCSTDLGSSAQCKSKKVLSS